MVSETEKLVSHRSSVAVLSFLVEYHHYYSSCYNFLCHGGNVFTSVHLLVCPLAGLYEMFSNCFHKTLQNYGLLLYEEHFQF